MAAAYAALVSLMHVLDQVLHPARHFIFVDPDRKQIQSLHKKVVSLLYFLEKYSYISSKERDDLENQVVDASAEAEDVIESLILDHILAPSTDKLEEGFRRFSQDIHEIIAEMDFIEERLMTTTKEETGIDSLVAGSPRRAPTSSGKNTMVGSDDASIQIMDRLTTQESDLKTVSIVGMGGIGKTTLARNVYDHQFIVERFDTRAWVTISQEYTKRQILSTLLKEVEIFFEKRKEEGNENVAEDTNSWGIELDEQLDEQLGEQLYKSLFGRRYLIIMDDMWTTKVWDEIRFFFPDNRNKSRIMITTRESKVARSIGSSDPYRMEFLDEDNSWKLFCEKTFLGESCPLELEKIGKKIAKSCRGLPLPIVVISGLLAKSNRTQKYWEYIAKNLKSVISAGNDGHCFKILSLSYNHLPIYLKPCLLYMASTFPEDYEVRVSRLIKLWVAEGFLKPVRGKSLEDVGKDYLNDLIDRNLILVNKRGTLGKIKSCTIHDLLRDWCLKEAQRENFLSVTKLPDIPLDINSRRHLSIHGILTAHRSKTQVLKTLRSASSARSLVSVFAWSSDKVAPHLRFLRALDVVDAYDPERIMFLVNLRYLAFRVKFTWNFCCTLPISLFWNLQTLSLSNGLGAVLPTMIWEMTQLRHLEFKEVVLPDPPHSDTGTQNFHILGNLQTLFTVKNFCCAKEVFERVPNIKKLKISYEPLLSGVEWSYYCLHNLVHLKKLESLKCETYNNISPRNLVFPCSLTKLTLRGCHMSWVDMTVIGSLPNLEVLKLERYAFVGPEWDANEEEFVRLKLLLIGRTNLEYWRADNTHFPSLEHLVLENVTKLEEIPLGLAEIHTLQLIQLKYCKESVVTSAKQLLEERDNLGYDGLQVQVRTSNGMEYY